MNNRRKRSDNSPFRIDVDNVHALQLLQDVASYRTTAFAEVRRAAAVPLPATINLLEATDANTLP